MCWNMATTCPCQHYSGRPVAPAIHSVTPLLHMHGNPKPARARHGWNPRAAIRICVRRIRIGFISRNRPPVVSVTCAVSAADPHLGTNSNGVCGGRAMSPPPSTSLNMSGPDCPGCTALYTENNGCGKPGRMQRGHNISRCAACILYFWSWVCRVVALIKSFVFSTSAVEEGAVCKDEPAFCSGRVAVSAGQAP